jgi:hypothetical protein
VPEEVQKPEVGSLIIDARPVAPFVVDLPSGAMQGMRTEQDGFEEVLNEIFSNQATLGELAGVTASDLAEIKSANEQIAEIDIYVQPAQKLAEVLVESRARLDDKRQRIVSAIAQSVESRAKSSGNRELLAKYEKTRVYRSAIGVKAARTRRRKAQESAARQGSAPKG